MWQWLRNTRLAKQLNEIATVRRSLRQAEHRHSLRLKRAAVRSRIMYEIHRQQIQKAVKHMIHAKLITSHTVAQNVISAHQQRQQKLKALLDNHGLKMPHNTRPHPVNKPDSEFKDKLFKGVENIIGDGSVIGRTLARDALKDTFGKVTTSGNEKDMAVALVAGLVKEIDLSRDELRGLFEVVERDGGDVGLRAAVLDALDKDSSSPTSR